LRTELILTDSASIKWTPVENRLRADINRRFFVSALR
jgi:hypothetical protein